jgi:hypothetical protein
VGLRYTPRVQKRWYAFYLVTPGRAARRFAR